MASMAYYLSNGNKYEVSFERDKIKVTEYRERFDGKFFSVSNVIWLDNFKEVREFLTEMNGGVEV